MSGQPPALSDETKSEILASSQKDAIGQNVSGKDGGDSQEGQKVKSKKERKCQLRFQSCSKHDYEG